MSEWRGLFEQGLSKSRGLSEQIFEGCIAETGIRGIVGRECWKGLLEGIVGRDCWKGLLEGIVGRDCWEGPLGWCMIQGEHQ